MEEGLWPRFQPVGFQAGGLEPMPRREDRSAMKRDEGREMTDDRRQMADNPAKDLPHETMAAEVSFLIRRDICAQRLI